MKLLMLGSGLALLACTFDATSVPDPYLGLTPPGSTPEVFAPGLVSQPDAYEYGSVWSEDGREFFFGVNVGDRAEIRGMHWTEDGWSAESVVISDPRYTFGDPFLSPDQDRLYFISNRPLEQLDGPPKDFDIWFIERKADGWSDAVNVGTPINSGSDEYYISFSAEGRLYFASNVAAGERTRNFDIYYADPSASGFETPVLLPGDANSSWYEADAFVSPDESYMIFSSARRDGLGDGDLYISFRGDDGAWSEAANLGPPFSTSGHELCPFVTNDGRFFFYTSNEDIYWVDATVLDQYRLSGVE